MRRSDREVKGIDNILKILEKCEVLRLGLCADNIPYVVPMNFAYEMNDDNIFIYLHCAKEGKKLDLIDINNNVCFEADCSCEIIKGVTPCSWTSKYESVIGSGEISRLSSEAEKINAMDLLMKRYGFEGKPTYPKHVLAAVEALRIKVTSISGKANL